MIGVRARTQSAQRPFYHFSSQMCRWCLIAVKDHFHSLCLIIRCLSSYALVWSLMADLYNLRPKLSVVNRARQFWKGRR